MQAGPGLLLGLPLTVMFIGIFMAGIGSWPGLFTYLAGAGGSGD